MSIFLELMHLDLQACKISLTSLIDKKLKIIKMTFKNLITLQLRNLNKHLKKIK